MMAGRQGDQLILDTLAYNRGRLARGQALPGHAAFDQCTVRRLGGGQSRAAENYLSGRYTYIRHRSREHL